MALIRVADPDFRVCPISLDTLIEIQLDAEDRRWGTRWSSVGALRSQVGPGLILLQSFMREEWGGDLRAYRCLLLFSAAEHGHGGGLATIDLVPARFKSLERLDRDPDVRTALARMFSLALSGTSMITKR
ncbi:hypothetical protein [Micromonospora mirobrigensis]|uniref:Uncharacterized protein n=1 Tax=Micromonospora mirobrigensis TaxID=262898 RepID=A0A1C5A337_9ACTN|nr:hypothetical protein [Micromonospora mirobrigensis]SCF39637.1 hypothetical protein GA0070564_107240 [Micromonospora mirobrigensis]